MSVYNKNSTKYSMIVRNRQRKVTLQSKRTHFLNDYEYQPMNPIFCKTTQWIFCVVMTISLLIMIYYASFTKYSSHSYVRTQFSKYPPSCSTLHDKISALSRPSSFKNLLHASFIPTISISLKSIKSNLVNLDTNSNQWGNSLYQ